MPSVPLYSPSERRLTPEWVLSSCRESVPQIGNIRSAQSCALLFFLWLHPATILPPGRVMKLYSSGEGALWDFLAIYYTILVLIHKEKL